MKFLLNNMRAVTRFFSHRTNLNTNPIEQCVETKEFKIKINNDFATVNYEKIDNSAYDLLHTNIPKAYHGQGLGPILAQRIFDHLIQDNKKMRVTCEFLQKYLSKNKEKYKNYVIND